MKTNKGQNIVEICVILVVVVIGGIVVYTALGDQINQLFTGSESKIKDFNPFNVKDKISVPTPSTPSVEPGTLGGSFDLPVQSCSGGECSIDFGDFVLTGIPDNFQSIVNASGTSGGTEVLANLIDQIVAQADKIDPPMDSNLIQVLANKGHSIASAQNAIDSAISSGKCTSSYIGEVAGCVGQSTGANSGANNLLVTFGETYQQILSSCPTPTPEQQNVLKTIEYLYGQITTAQNNLSGKITQLQGMTVDQASLDNGTFNAQFNNLGINSSYSPSTHVKSGIICATGHGDDTGTDCTPST